MAVPYINGCSLITDRDLERRLSESFHQGYNKGVKRAEDFAAQQMADLRTYVAQLEKTIVDQMARMTNPIYYVVAPTPPPVGPAEAATARAAFSHMAGIEKRVAALEQANVKVPYVFEETTASLQKQVNAVKEDVLVVARHFAKTNDEVTNGMKLTSDRVTNVAARVTEVERLKNTKADAVNMARIEARLSNHIHNPFVHL